MRTISWGELDCYKNLTDEEKQNKLISPNIRFRLYEMPTDSLQEEMERFIRYRGTVLKGTSIRSEVTLFHELCRFIRDSYPELASFREIEDFSVYEKKYRTWLMKQNKPLFYKHSKYGIADMHTVNAPGIGYSKRVWEWANGAADKPFCIEDDEWCLEKLDIPNRKDPTRRRKTISFRNIMQTGIRRECKEVIYNHFRTLSEGTIMDEMKAMKRFSSYLEIRYPKIDSLAEVDRAVFEEYLVYMNTQPNRKKSHSKELHSLKSIFITAGKLFEVPRLESLIVMNDLNRKPVVLYKYYSDNEIKRFNEVLLQGDEQIARIMILHQLLGTRISETLTLLQEDLNCREGYYVLTIRQLKTRKTYEKVVSEEIASLLNKSMEYTNEKYGVRKYIFVSPKYPEKPMQYSCLMHQLRKVVYLSELKADNGEPFQVKTHRFRHNYAKRLTDLHVSDEKIAALLGHANTSTVRHYRKISNHVMTEETKAVRDSMDLVLQEIMKGWRMYEQV